MRKLTGIYFSHAPAASLINQIREREIGMFGNPTTGGSALEFYSSVRIEIRPHLSLKTATRQWFCLAKVVKNKVTPIREAEFELMFGEGYQGRR